MKAFLKTTVWLALAVLCGCAGTGPAVGAEGTYTWTYPDTTTIGLPINPDFVDHFVVLYRSAADTTGMDLLEAVVYDESAVPPWTTGTLDPMTYYQFAVVGVDTTATPGLTSPWSLPWRPADSDPGRAAAPGAPALIDSEVW